MFEVDEFGCLTEFAIYPTIALIVDVSLEMCYSQSSN